MALFQTDRIFHERRDDMSAEIEARKLFQFEVEPLVMELVRKVEVEDEPRDPADLGLDADHLQLGMTLEHAAEDQLVDRLVVSHLAATEIGDVMPSVVHPGDLRPGVEGGWDAELFDHPPEPIPVRVVPGGVACPLKVEVPSIGRLMVRVGFMCGA